MKNGKYEIKDEEGKNNRVEYYRDDVLHREDGPAVEMSNGDKFWYKGGVLHRVDGPAIEKQSGHQEWWLHGIAHPLNKNENEPSLVSSIISKMRQATQKITHKNKPQ